MADDTVRVTMLRQTSSRYGKFKKGEEAEVPRETAIRWDAYRIATPTTDADLGEGDDAGSTAQSGDLTAKDAIAYIRDASAAELAGFLSKGEKRKTVRDAYKARAKA